MCVKVNVLLAARLLKMFASHLKEGFKHVRLNADVKNSSPGPGPDASWDNSPQIQSAAAQTEMTQTTIKSFSYS